MVFKNLRELREERDMTREDLASKLGVSTQTIYRWETKETKPHKIFKEKLNRIFST